MDNAVGRTEASGRPNGWTQEFRMTRAPKTGGPKFTGFPRSGFRSAEAVAMQPFERGDGPCWRPSSANVSERQTANIVGKDYRRTGPTAFLLSTSPSQQRHHVGRTKRETPNDELSQS